MATHGFPVLATDGSITLNDGLRLDGSSRWVDGSFDEKDCLVDPGQCSNEGFSLAGKFHFDLSKINYREARYVLDTGAHAGRDSGISMYLMAKVLYFQLTAVNRTWTVNMFNTSFLPWQGFQLKNTKFFIFYFLETWPGCQFLYLSANTYGRFPISRGRKAHVWHYFQCEIRTNLQTLVE